MRQKSRRAYWRSATVMNRQLATQYYCFTHTKKLLPWGGKTRRTHIGGPWIVWFASLVSVNEVLKVAACSGWWLQEKHCCVVGLMPGWEWVNGWVSLKIKSQGFFSVIQQPWRDNDTAENLNIFPGRITISIVSFLSFASSFYCVSK